MVEFRYRLPDAPQLEDQDPIWVGIRSWPSRVAIESCHRELRWLPSKEVEMGNEFWSGWTELLLLGSESKPDCYS